MHKGKSRDQSLYEFLECLQLEYITCELRKKVYPKRKDKDYYARTMDRKKSKIEDIATRNHLPTIFNSTKEQKALYKKVYKKHGYPDFAYNSDKDRDEFFDKDRANYYLEKSEVRVLEGDGEIIVGVITKAFLDKKIVHVKLRNCAESNPYPIDRVTRIL